MKEDLRSRVEKLLVWLEIEKTRHTLADISNPYNSEESFYEGGCLEYIETISTYLKYILEETEELVDKSFATLDEAVKDMMKRDKENKDD